MVDRSWASRGAAVATAGLVAVVVAVTAAKPGSPPREGGTGHAGRAVVAAPSPAQRPAPPAVSGTLIATLREATPFSAVAGGPPVGVLPAANPFGTPEVLVLVGPPTAAGWARVELPIRPNGSVGWIRTAGVALTETSYQVLVSLSAHTLTVTEGGRIVLTAPAAVGKPSTPTPPAHTYLWELIRPDDPQGAYGPYIFGLALFSNAYAVFNGGDAQIGIHGQDEPWSVGHSVSNGCIRLGNDVITRLAGLLPLGTPVTIV
jgi:lipoprotein-anchoring transpeptidase ErfK/SrfK